MNKAEVTKEISKRTGIPYSDVSLTMEAFIEVTKEYMAQGHNIHYKNFGSFINKKRAAKIARNLKNNTALPIKAHYVPSFKPSKIFIEKIKQNLSV